MTKKSFLTIHLLLLNIPLCIVCLIVNWQNNLIFLKIIKIIVVLFQ